MELLKVFPNNTRKPKDMMGGMNHAHANPNFAGQCVLPSLWGCYV